MNSFFSSHLGAAKTERTGAPVFEREGTRNLCCETDHHLMIIGLLESSSDDIRTPQVDLVHISSYLLYFFAFDILLKVLV